MESDTTAMTAQEEEKKGQTLDVDLLTLVKSSQNQNGLRHNDYGRYHHYCIRKLHRMRKSLKFTQGRKQFVKRQVTAEEVSKNHKYVHVLVFKCEANWAYAMQQRQIIAQAGGNRNPNRVRYLAKKRL
jgi:signal recognition particle subunit SRP68